RHAEARQAAGIRPWRAVAPVIRLVGSEWLIPAGGLPHRRRLVGRLDRDDRLPLSGLSPYSNTDRARDRAQARVTRAITRGCDRARTRGVPVMSPGDTAVMSRRGPLGTLALLPRLVPLLVPQGHDLRPTRVPVQEVMH